MIFIATKYQEIYPPELDVQARFMNSSPELIINLEAEILATMDYKIQPTIELSVMGIIKAELDIKILPILDKLDSIIADGVLIGLLRENRIISTLFGLVYIQTNKLSIALSSKFDRICKKYEIDISQARIDATAFLNLFSKYRGSFKECSDLLHD